MLYFVNQVYMTLEVFQLMSEKEKKKKRQKNYVN